MHKTAIRVRYAETDRMGVAYYGDYFTWFEVARTEHFRRIGLLYTELEKEGIRLMVVSAKCTYKAPATYDDMLHVESEITNVKNTSLSFTYMVYRQSTLVATGGTDHVFTDEKGKPIKIPERAKEILNASVL
ncbi:MAG: acyl-CoA thioesterase [Candidatus Omnitrophica bacterium]|nr:acyl-CoA thioesterase [Candidatus Omnitrophota bacterium]